MVLIIHGYNFQDMGQDLYEMRALISERVIFILHDCNWPGCHRPACEKPACNRAEHIIIGDWSVCDTRPEPGAYFQALAMSGAPEDMLREWAHHLEMIPDDKQRSLRMIPWVCIQLDYYYQDGNNYAEMLASRLSPYVRDSVMEIYGVMPEEQHYNLIIKLVRGRIPNLEVSGTTML